MTGTAVPLPTFGPRGFVAPDDSAILAGVQADQQSAFGGGVNPALTTAQGQLAVSETAIISDNDALFLALMNGVDPAYATGRLQDAIARIYFLERIPAAPTVVQALCTGLPGTFIAAGALAKAVDGNLYVCNAGAVIPSTGSITLEFSCIVAGPIACPANTLNIVYRQLAGWDTINNVSDGTIGNAVESRAAFEARRAASVAINAVGVLGAIRGEVLAVPGVLDAFVTENDTGSTATIRGVSGVVAHSLYVSVLGGNSTAVATAIWQKKNPGCNYNGNTTVTVYDTQSGYTAPYPSYAVSFEIPAALGIYYQVDLVDNGLVPADAAAQIQAVMVAAFNGLDGGSRAQIGATLFASRFYAGIIGLGSWVELLSVTMGSLNASAASITASIAATTMTVTAVGSGALAPNQLVTGANVADGSFIVSQLTGSTGSTGTYKLATTQTVGSEAMVAVAPSLTSIAVNMNQTPALDAPNINLILH